MNIDTKRVFFITTSIPESADDWRSIFIGDMLNTFSKGMDNLIYWGPNGAIPKSAIYSVSYHYKCQLDKMNRKGGIAKILRSSSLWDKIFYTIMLLHGIRRGAKSHRMQFDTYFVNWLQNTLSLPSDNKPIVVTVLGSDMALLKFRFISYMLRRKFKKHKTTILPNAKWMVEKLEKLFGDVAEVHFLPLGIREEWFDHIDRSPTEWLSVSRITENKVRKLFNWGDTIFTKSNRLNFVGPCQETVEIPDWVDVKGAATMQELKERWYPEAKALIFLSDHDEGRPQTIIESMASGVPVVCLNKPLYREFIESGFNGYLVNDAKELKIVLEKLNEPSHNFEISKNARNSIRKNIGSWEAYTNNVKRML